MSRRWLYWRLVDRLSCRSQVVSRQKARLWNSIPPIADTLAASRQCKISWAIGFAFMLFFPQLEQLNAKDTAKTSKNSYERSTWSFKGNFSYDESICRLARIHERVNEGSGSGGNVYVPSSVLSVRGITVKMIINRWSQAFVSTWINGVGFFDFGSLFSSFVWLSFGLERRSSTGENFCLFAS